jgi:hypothetical protein
MLNACGFCEINRVMRTVTVIEEVEAHEQQAKHECAPEVVIV